MTHKHLEEYFHIINQPKKELTMFEVIKAKWTELFATRYEFVNDPPPIVIDPPTPPQKDGWTFSMVTEPWCDEYDEWHPLKATVISGNNDGTWMETLDQILDVLGEHYGYNIKEQVYYSVVMPVNNGFIEGLDIEFTAGNTRSLNDEVLQQLLLAYPEVYDWQGHKGFKL